MKELERQQKEASDEDERMSVGSRGSLRSHVEYAGAYPVTNGYEEDMYGSSQSRKSSRASYYPDLGLPNSGYASTSQPSSQNGNWASVYDESVYSGSRRYSASSSRAIEERPEKDFEKGARTVSSLSAATLASLGGTSSRRGSGDTSISADTEASIREIKDSLAEVEEKYKKAMVSNAQLDNEKTNFMYQVDTLKDALLELEEQLAESRRQYEEKSKEFEREKHAHSILQFQFKEIKEALKQREEMLAEIQQLQQKQQSYVREISDLQETIEWKDKKIGALERQKDFFDSIRSERDDLRDEVIMLKEQLKKHGIIPDSDIATNGEASDVLDNEGHLDSSKTVQGTTQALKTAGDGMLGKANEVDMKNEILEDVGKREILQNSEREEHKEESEEQEVQTLHADENTKAEKMIEETDGLSTVMLPDSRFTEQIPSLTEPMSGNASSNDGSGGDGLRMETESADTAAQQPVSKEAEHGNLNPRTTENSEVGSLQGQDFESPQETHGDSDAEHELVKAAPQQEGEDVEASHALSANEVEQAADSAHDSSEMVSVQSGLPDPVLAGLLSEEVNVEGHAETLQCLEESAGNKVTEVLEKTLVESKDCTGGTADKTGGDRAGEQNEVWSAVQGQKMERDSTGLEGEESCESGAPSDPNEEGGDQAHIQPVSSEVGELALLEEQNTQEQTELKPAEKDGQEEVLIGNLEACSDPAEKQEKASESVGSANEVEGNVLHQTEPDMDSVKEMAAQETSLDPDFSDDEIEETEMQTGDVSGKGEGNRIEDLEHNTTEDLKPKAELQTVQCSEETTGDTEDEKNTSLESEAQNADKQEEGESKEESIVCHSVTSESQVDKEALKENKKESEPADHQGDGFTSVEDADSSLALKAELDENASEQLKLEGQAEEEQEDDGDAFDFDEDSEQTVETDEKCDGEEVDAQSEEDDRTNSVIRKTAQTGEAGEGSGKIETSDTLTEDDSLQHKEGNESEETELSQEEASALETDEKADVLADEDKASDPNEVEKEPGEQDLESAGCSRAESKEDLRGGRKGKGKSKDDCTMS
ncbi:leucine-rich repeat flightless-interacting protein 1 isoform X6 [Gallus gallus]|uniref:leucine-rich repeat flightless-interacting protein 1 isoform X6 n=1 Tax=Gallus gallus TaxID=9031 RepID=UPI001EFF91A8|nr:leucine-rich repeat flightless-interacting protein 1 isoform X6 [Gallus gallus]